MTKPRPKATWKVWVDSKRMHTLKAPQPIWLRVDGEDANWSGYEKAIVKLVPSPSRRKKAKAKRSAP